MGDKKSKPNRIENKRNPKSRKRQNTKSLVSPSKNRFSKI